MLTFKQFLQKYPNGHYSKPSVTLPKVKSCFAEAKMKQKIENLDKWELIQFIAESPVNTVEVTLTPEGVFFRFVESAR